MKKPQNRLLYLLAVLLSTVAVNAQKKIINLEMSNIRWYGEQITGKEHFGNLKFLDGEIELKNDIVVSGFFTVDMKSLTVEDLSGTGKKRLEGHLKGENWFGVSSFPESKLKITQIGKVEGDVQKIQADLSIKGNTNNVTFSFEMVSENNANSNLTFNRAKYNVTNRSGSFFDDLGDRLILDDIRLEVDLHFN